MKFYDSEHKEEFDKLKKEILLNRNCGDVIVDLKKIKADIFLNSPDIHHDMMKTADIVNSYVKSLGCRELAYDEEWLENNKSFLSRFVDINDEESVADYNKKVEELYYTMQNNIAWDQLNRSQAEKISSYILDYDLAYNVPIIEKNLAENLSSKFLNFFSEEAVFFTNASFSDDEGEFHIDGWSPITDATFDSGIIVFDGSLIGILWVMDED